MTSAEVAYKNIKDTYDTKRNNNKKELFKLAETTIKDMQNEGLLDKEFPVKDQHQAYVSDLGDELRSLGYKHCLVEKKSEEESNYFFRISVSHFFEK